MGELFISLIMKVPHLTNDCLIIVNCIISGSNS